MSHILTPAALIAASPASAMPSARLLNAFSPTPAQAERPLGVVSRAYAGGEALAIDEPFSEGTITRQDCLYIQEDRTGSISDAQIRAFQEEVRRIQEQARVSGKSVVIRLDLTSRY